MMRSLGASPVEVAKMAATNPARLLGINQECGSIEEGKLGDLVVLNSDYFSVANDDLKKIRSVLTVVGGNINFDAGVLDTRRW